MGEKAAQADLLTPLLLCAVCAVCLGVYIMQVKWGHHLYWLSRLHKMTFWGFWELRSCQSPYSLGIFRLQPVQQGVLVEGSGSGAVAAVTLDVGNCVGVLHDLDEPHLVPSWQAAIRGHPVIVKQPALGRWRRSPCAKAASALRSKSDLRSRPSFFHRFSMSWIICRVSMSCRRSKGAEQKMEINICDPNFTGLFSETSYLTVWMNACLTILFLTVSIFEDDAHHVSFSCGIPINQPERLHLGVHKSALISAATAKMLILNNQSSERRSRFKE